MTATAEQIQIGTPEPLTSWKNAPTILDLKQDLQDSRPLHAIQEGKINGWLDNLHVTGSAKVKARRGNSSIVPRLIRKQAEWRYAALSEPFLSTDDVFNVRPVTWEDKKAAEQNELVLNHQFNTQLDKVRFIDSYVRTAVNEGTVIIKTGWEFVEEAVDVEVPIVEFVVDPNYGEATDALTQMQSESPSEYADQPEEIRQAHEVSLQYGTPYRPQVTGSRTERQMKTVKNRPTLEICDYRNVVIDPTCLDDVSKARFAIYSFETSLSDLKKDGRYKNLDQINVAGNGPLSQPDHSSSTGVSGFQFNDKPRQKLVVYEYWGYWDIDGSGIVKPFVAAWVGDVLIRMEANPFPDKGIPFVVVPFLPVARSIYGEPDGALLEDNQRINGAVTRGMIDIMAKSANGQTGMSKALLDTTNQKKFENGDDYQFNPQTDPRSHIFMHTYPEIPASAQFMVQLQQMEADSMSGVKSYGGGISGAALGDVAAGIRGALDAASKRELGILRRLTRGLIEVARKIISMNAVFLSDEEIIRITNEQFVKVRRDDLPGNFDLRVTISTAEEDNNKAEQLAFMLQTVGPNTDPDMMKMILSDICKLRKMPDLAHKIENYQPQPDPVQQEMQQLELARIRLEVAKLNAETAKLNADAQQSAAKTENIQADTDLKNLQFVETESGVTQERDLQKQKAQARGNIELEVVKAAVAPKKPATKK